MASSDKKDKRTTHVPVTIDGRKAVLVRSTSSFNVFEPQREDGQTTAPFPHVTVRSDSVHVSDLVPHGSKPSYPNATHVVKSTFQDLTGGKAPKAKPQQLREDGEGWFHQVKSSGEDVENARPISPRTARNSSARFGVTFEAIEKRVGTATESKKEEGK